MQPEIQHSYEEIAKLPAQVTALSEQLAVRIGLQADLAKMIRLCTDVHKKVPDMTPDQILEVAQAQRVLLAIVNSAHEVGLKAPLERIATSVLEPTTTIHSEGKDAVFELELLQYIKFRGLHARLGEPDVVVESAPYGNYFVACKTINSLNNIKGQLRSGYGQVEKYGHGCVAFNFEPHMCFEQPLRVQTAREASHILNKHLRGLYGKSKNLFDRKLQDGRLDGVVLQMSCFADVAESKTDLDVFTHTVYYLNPRIQDADARSRFNWFVAAMQGPLRPATYGFGSLFS